MKKRFIPLMAAAITICFPLLLRAEAVVPENGSAEDKAFHAVEAVMGKIQQGGDGPNEADYAARRTAGGELTAKAKKFLADYPASGNAENAQALLHVGLYEAALAGDDAARADLRSRAARIPSDTNQPPMLKMYVSVLNYIAQWAQQNGKRHLNQGSPEFQKQYLEGMFQAASAIADNDGIYKMILLQAKSGRELSPEEKRAVADRVQKATSASVAMREEARKIALGEQSYALGKSLDLQFTAVDGRKVNLHDMAGKVVLVDFWATWCGPCVAEVPTVKAVYDAYHSKGFEIIGISLDEDKSKLLEFTKKHGMDWPQFFDGKQWNNELGFRFGINAVPTMWLVDKQGVLRSTDARGSLETSVRAMLEAK